MGLEVWFFRFSFKFRVFFVFDVVRGEIGVFVV